MTLNRLVNSQFSISKEKMTKTCTQDRSDHEISVVCHKDQHEPKADAYQNSIDT